jgi:hypothetical protein
VTVDWCKVTSSCGAQPPRPRRHEVALGGLSTFSKCACLLVRHSETKNFHRNENKSRKIINMRSIDPDRAM